MASWTFAAPGWSPSSPSAVSETEPRREQPVHHDVVHAPCDAVVILHQAQELPPPPGRLPSRAGDQLPGRMRGSSSSDVTASQGTAAGVCIAGAPRVLTGRDWPCHHGLEQRGHLRLICSGLAQDHANYTSLPGTLRLAPLPWIGVTGLTSACDAATVQDRGHTVRIGPTDGSARSTCRWNNKLTGCTVDNSLRMWTAEGPRLG